jgi:pyruvate,orthophosphate dikinase
VDSNIFEKLLEDKKRAKDIQNDDELSSEDLQQLIVAFKASYRQVLGLDFPNDPQQQTCRAISAAFGSWINQRAVTYRRLNNIPSHWGTALNV